MPVISGPTTITLASHYLGESHTVLGQTQPSQGKRDSNDWWAGPCPVILSRYSPFDLLSLKVTSTLLHAQMTNGKCCPLQFYKTASFPWDRDENLIDHCVELLKLAFYRSECTTHGQDSDPGQYWSHLTPSPNTQYSLPKCCLLGSPTEKAICRGVNKTHGKDIEN